MGNTMSVYSQKKKQIAAKSVLMYPQAKTANRYRRFDPFSRDYFGEDFRDYTDYFREAFHDYIIMDKNVLDQMVADRELSRDREVRNLRKIVSILYSKLNKIESQFPECTETQEVTRDVPVKEAKPMVRTYLKKYLEKHKRVYPSDVADALGLRYETVRAVFAILEHEGTLKVSE